MSLISATEGLKGFILESTTSLCVHFSGYANTALPFGSDSFEKLERALQLIVGVAATTANYYQGG